VNHQGIVFLLAVSLLGPFAAMSRAAGAPSPDRPNVILLVIDDQGFGDVGRHGNPVLRTPNLDRLHDEGARFSNFVVSPSCSPTRAALMTGRHEFKSGVTHTIPGQCELNLRSTTLAQVLKSAGYATGLFGKWHLGAEGDYRPETRGFDVAVTTVGDTQNSHFDPTLLFNGVPRPMRGYREDILFAEALRFIRGARARPFFCYVATYSPHSPLKVPPEYTERNNGNPFFGMISNVDDNIGRLLAALREEELESRTLVIAMNDNGGTGGVDIHNAGMRGCKGIAWFGGTRAFSFWRWPGRIPPQTLRPLAGHVDVLPTLAELTGADLPASVGERLDGVSLVPLLTGAARELPDRMLFTHVGRWLDTPGQAEAHKYAFCAVHWGNYHLVRSETAPGCTVSVCGTHQRAEAGGQVGYTRNGPFHYATNPGRTWSLHDIRQDPAEETDLAATEPQVVRRMAEAYERWWAEVLPHASRGALPR
jgi:arylsulfatase A-like enzyme